MTNGKFNGKVAFVTGGASGIGAAVVRMLAREGASIGIADINESAGHALSADVGVERATFCRCDVSQFDDVRNAVERVVERFGRLDLVFNIAGTGAPLAETPDCEPENWNRIVSVNLNSVFHVCKAAIPALRRAGGGAIVNIGSIAGLAGDYGLGAYGATKAAVINYTRSLALDHAKDNIRVNVLCPGLIVTPLSAGLHGDPDLRETYLKTIPMGRMGTVEEMAKIAAFPASDDASYITGAVLIADGGLMAHSGFPNAMAAIGGVWRQQRAASDPV